MSSLERKLREIAERVDSIILESLKGSEDVKRLYESSRYLFLGGGKRLRPSIVVLFSELVNGDLNRAYFLGAAVEVLHTFTLIHDDIMDNDPIRRGMPAVHVKYGTPMAILAGDLLHVKSFELLNRGLKNLSQDRVHKGLEKFIETIITISEGQALDMEFEDKKEVSEEEYFEMIKKKTAWLFACSAYLGTLTGDTSDEDLSNAFNFGLNLGIAFQIVDDILGITANEKELGKPVYSDIREGKKTILVIRALKQCNSKEREKLESVLGNRNASKEELEEVANILKEKALSYAYDIAEFYMNESIRYLNKLNWSNQEAGKYLIDLARFTVIRKK